MEQESLNKTWFIDIDGTIVNHMSNQELDQAIGSMGEESHLLEKTIDKSLEFMSSIPSEDTVVLTTARDTRHKQHTLKMLEYFSIRYDEIMFDLRSGPRYLINDIKPVGTAGNSKPLNTAHAINVERDKGISIESLS
tara:strand:+ start:4037 stop:4447 length:411 start_codon:yes stop_codon:yes gene_type:complete